MKAGPQEDKIQQAAPSQGRDGAACLLFRRELLPQKGDRAHLIRVGDVGQAADHPPLGKQAPRSVRPERFKMRLVAVFPEVYAL